MDDAPHRDPADVAVNPGSGKPTPRPRRGAVRWAPLLLVPGGLFLLVFVLRAHRSVPGFSGFTLFDDAMISMSYARTLVEHGDWVWFAGAPRVQGFTNPLWTLYMALVQAPGLRGSSAALVVSLTGAAFVIGCALLVARVVRAALDRSDRAEWTAWVAAGTVPFAYPLTLWSLRGMEVGLLAFLALAMVVSLVALLRRWDAGTSTGPVVAGFAVAASAGVLTRLDFLLLAAVVGVLAFVWAPGRRARATLLAGLALPIAVVTAGLLVFQKAYYHDWLTNTYRLKIQGTSVGERLARGVMASGKVLPITVIVALAVFVVFWSGADLVAKRITVVLGAMWAVVILYSVWVGGDAWEWSRMANRYVAVALPGAVAVVFIALARLLEVQPRVGRASVAALFAIVLAGAAYGAKTNPFDFDPRDSLIVMAGLFVTGVVCLVASARGSRAGDDGRGRGGLVVLAAGFLVVMVAVSVLPGFRWAVDGGIHVSDDARASASGLELRAATDPDAVIATVWAGSPAYYAERSMLDLLGKSDRVVASTAPVRIPGTELAHFYPGHDKQDFDYSIGRLRPDVVFGVSSGVEQYGYDRWCLSDGEIVYVRRSSSRVDTSRFRACA